MENKWCSKCGYNKPQEEFAKDHSKPSGYGSICKVCKNLARKDHYYSNHEQNIQRVVEYQKRNPEKIQKHRRDGYIRNKAIRIISIRKQNNTSKGKARRKRIQARRRGAKQSILTAEQWQWLLEEWDFGCAYCKVKFDEENHPTQDHVIPLSKGGNHSFSNCVPSCMKCNIKKSDKTATPGEPVP